MELTDVALFAVFLGLYSLRKAGFTNDRTMEVAIGITDIVLAAVFIGFAHGW